MLKLSERKAVNRGLQVGISMRGCLGVFLIGLGFFSFFALVWFSVAKKQQRKDVAAKQQRYKEVIIKIVQKMCEVINPKAAAESSSIVERRESRGEKAKQKEG